MKHLFVLVAVALLTTAAVCAQEKTVDVTDATTTAASQIDLGDFPVGSWLDEEWQGLWKFTSKNIELYKNGELVYSFNGHIKNWKVNAGTKGVTISFGCDATYRDYSFNKDISFSKDITLTIDNHATGEHYEKKLTYQK